MPWILEFADLIEAYLLRRLAVTANFCKVKQSRQNQNLIRAGRPACSLGLSAQTYYVARVVAPLVDMNHANLKKIDLG
jgi:hypothetical protein